MSLSTVILTVLGLALFEVVSGIDNAIINAEVLSTMQKKYRRWFLVYGILIAVFVVRGLLPWAIVWMATPSLGFIGSFTAAFSNNSEILSAVHASSPTLLAGGGTFLLLIFLYWIFLENDRFGLSTEKFFAENGVWFYSFASVILAIIVWFALKINSNMAFGAIVGSTAFFITNGFKQNAEESEKRLMSKDTSDWAKILYLEIIDASFSVDGVLGAFAFTLSVPLILIGNGIGAVVVRQLTLGNINNIKKLVYLKNGAMYSIAFLGIVMLMDSFGFEIQSWVSPLITFAVVGYFFAKSKKRLERKTS